MGKGKGVAAPDSDSPRPGGAKDGKESMTVPHASGGQSKAYSSPRIAGSTRTPDDPEYGGNVANAKLGGEAEDYSHPQKLGGDIGEVGGTGVSGRTQVSQFTGDGPYQEARDAQGSEQRLYANSKKGATGRP